MDHRSVGLPGQIVGSEDSGPPPTFMTSPSFASAELSARSPAYFLRPSDSILDSRRGRSGADKVEGRHETVGRQKPSRTPENQQGQSLEIPSIRYHHACRVGLSLSIPLSLCR